MHESIITKSLGPRSASGGATLAALVVWLGLAALASAQTSATAPPLPLAEPAAAKMNAQRLREIDDVVAAAIAEKQMPGCVVCIGRRGKIVWLKAYGDRQIEPRREAMTTDTLFDLASLTKPVATATSVMLLVEQGKIELDEPASRYLNDFTGHDKEKITIRQLLLHTSGLTPDNALEDYHDGPDQAWRNICKLKLLSPPGERFRYSDVGFIVLGKLIERVSETPLDQFARNNLFAPLGMSESGFLPPEDLKMRAAPTEKRDGQWIRGEVHDPRSWRLGGVAGHAGLFATAEDLARYAQMMLGEGSCGDMQVFKPETVAAMTTAHEVSGGLRGLGWDMRTGYSSNRGEGFSDAAFGHGGFTGTALWIDPKSQLVVIFLSNRLHPDSEGSVNRLAGRIGGIAAASLED